MRILLVFVLCLTVPFSVASSNIPIEAYGKLPDKSLLVLSPSSKRIAYRQTSNNRDTVLVIDINSGKMIGGVEVSAVNPSHMYFIDEDTLILVASETRVIRGFFGRHKISAAFAFNIDTQKMHQLLIQGYGIYKGQSELGNVLGVSADGQYAYMPAYADEVNYNLYRVRLDKKARPKVVQRGKSDTIDYFLDGEGNVIARERFNNKYNKHSIESKLTGDWQQVFTQETEYRTKSFVGVTPDKKSLVMLSTNPSTGRWAYYTLSLVDGSIAGPVFSRDDKDIESVITDIQRVVHGVRYSGFTPSYEFFDKKLNVRMRGINKVLPNNSVTITDYTPDWNSIILYMDGQQSSGDYLLYNKGKIEYLASRRPDIPGASVYPVEEYELTARDGMKIPTLLTLPKGSEKGNLPAILMPHGGPESYNKITFDYKAQYFASQGYLVIQPQFRGSTGFGVDHLLAGRGEWGRKMQDDLSDAVLDLAKSGKINKDRVCIVGSSYGGYAALAGAVFTPELYKCVVSINGVSDVEEMLDEEEENYGSNHWVVAYWKEVIAKGEVEEDHLEQISPINHVKNIKAPILLIHGEYDKIVPIDQSEEMLDELEDEDKDVTFIELDKGDHHLSSAVNRMKAMQEMGKFIKKHI